MVAPSSTWELEDWSVFQVMVAEVAVIPLDATLEIMGAGTATVVAVVDWFAVAAM